MVVGPQSLGPNGRNLERHPGGLALPPDTGVRDPRVIPHDILAARLEREVRDEDGHDDLYTRHRPAGGHTHVMSASNAAKTKNENGMDTYSARAART